MLDAIAATFASKEYYAPVATTADPGPRFTPSSPAPGWRHADQDIWTAWSPARAARPDEGWKIHVSARLDRAQAVLDHVARICFAEGVPFKHVAARTFFIFLHRKHANRVQSGKFCAIYPPDAATARRLLDLLSDALRDEDGPYVLSDRRFGDSRTVHYRYGAFRPRGALQPDGTTRGLVRDGSGIDVPDERRPCFVLPEGITDPFVTEEPQQQAGPIVIHGYEITKALQPSNAGGTYLARDTRDGRRVFVKEARAHNGLEWDGTDAKARLRHEHEVLTAVHAKAPGVAPEPLDYFSEWEHEFLVTEYVEGEPLRLWLSRTSPLIRTGRSAADYASFFDAARRIVRTLDTSLDALHDLGYRFGDISLGNIIVAEDGDARLVDFEAASLLDDPPARLGTRGFTPSSALLGTSDDAVLTDRFGMSAIALAFFAPFHEIAERVPGNLALLRHDLSFATPPPDDLWTRATTYYPSDEATGPSPAEVDADPLGCLRRFADAVAAGLLDSADLGRREWVFPPSPQAFGSNTVCVAYGSAGVVHALHRAGVLVPDEIVERLRQDTMAKRAELPPGLDVGTAGIARVLAALGHLDEAIDLARSADDHPLSASCTTLAGGLAGVGLTWLALHRITHDARQLDRAVAGGDAICEIVGRGTAELLPTLGASDARGLFHGRSGLALFLHHLAEETGEERYLATGVRLLHEELDRAIAVDDGSLSFADNAVIKRFMPYLPVGAAGVGTVLSRYVATSQDERLRAALPRVAAGTSVANWTREAGLYEGLAGLAWFLADYADADCHDDADAAQAARDTALRATTGLLKYAVPRTRGVRFLGSGSQRFSSDLSSGGAGVLLAVHRFLDGPGDELFTLDPVMESQLWCA
ncbi:MAG TPA: class III lanthionine synthetase LanKC [Actinospica sp.]|nr:class III lanthionine synthetase LanKC [Actinospica sp.]